MCLRGLSEVPFSNFSFKQLLFYVLALTLSPEIVFAKVDCSQIRKTELAPAKILKMENPIPENPLNLKAGESLYQGKAKPIACNTCHGKNGNGKGDPSFESNPSSRNFTCAEIMKTLPDGQLFWIIKNGSKGTSMFSFSNLSDNEIWQLIHYVRQFAK
jgi:mono/diheme cytochrome c family protein